MSCHVPNIIRIVSGPHGGARDGNRLFTRTMQQIVEFHAWQVLRYDPK